MTKPPGKPGRDLYLGPLGTASSSGRAAGEHSHRPNHATHPDIIKRLKRAEGHLRKVIEMMETGSPCLSLAQQIYAVETAITNAKNTLIHDHIDHCLEASSKGRKPHDLEEFKQISKYL